MLRNAGGPAWWALRALAVPLSFREDEAERRLASLAQPGATAEETEGNRLAARRSQEQADERLMAVAVAAPAVLCVLGFLWLLFGSPVWVGNVAIYTGAGLYALYGAVVVVWAWRYR